jgi:hypothetical protein
MEITTMFNMTREFVFITLCGAFLAAGSNASQASNTYNAASIQTGEVRMTESKPGYWACPAEYGVCSTERPPITAKAEDQHSRTDATVWDAPEQPTWSLEYEMRFYDYSGLILGD